MSNHPTFICSLCSKCVPLKNKSAANCPSAAFLPPLFCGENEIRTRDTLLAYTRFPGVPLQPLEHLSLFSNKETDNGNIFSTKEIAA